MKKGDRVFLVDGSGYIFRAYHALPPLTRKSDGLPCGAVAGFCNMVWKLICEAKTARIGHKKGRAGKDQPDILPIPTHFAIIFDHSSTTFRKKLYPEYKANRPSPPDDLIPQFSLIRAATRAFNLPCIEKEGYEADDILATYARRAEKAGAEVIIISSDKDLMQLVGKHIKLYDTMKDKVTGIAEVEEKWGVLPEKMIDFQALVGDSVDNIPGVAGIGPKTAAELLQRFGSLDAILARTDEITQKKRRETLEENADKARLSRELVTLCPSVPLDLDLEDFALLPPDAPKLIAFLKAMEFNTLTRRVAKLLDIDAEAVDPAFLDVKWDKSTAETNFATEDSRDSRAGTLPQKAPTQKEQHKTALNLYDEPVSPQALAAQQKEVAKNTKIDRSCYQMLQKPEDLAKWLAEAGNQGFMAFDTETNCLNPFEAELIGFSLALAPHKAAYVPLAHSAKAADLLGEAPHLDGQMDKAQALALLKPVLETDSILKIGQNIKYDIQIMAGQGINLRCFDDTMLLSYVLSAGAQQSHGLDALAQMWLNHKTISYSDVVGSGSKAVSFAEVPLDKATEYAAEDADITLRLWQVLKPQLVAKKLMHVYERLERPLVPVLAKMESRGILIDKVILHRLSQQFLSTAAKIAVEIYALAGEEFNIGSPKQLGDILFGKFSLPGGHKTKSGQWSTTARHLDELATDESLKKAGGIIAQGQELASKIVAWRQVKKLQSTYTDALPAHSDAHGRIHTNYSLAGTTTGRLASSDPNLQNIPVRTQEGRLIRTAFIAPEGKMLLSADYSQIELRILAHVADIGALKQAFAQNIDIHAMTASEIFSVPLRDMTAEIRRRAKAINFGIIYGISAFGLANQLGISREEAGQYIHTYFERFPGIKTYMEETKAFARQHGYVETIFGRRVHYPQISSSNPQLRAFNERAAINAPIQGTAADIIRRAMIKMEENLQQKGLKAQMLCQVHDELIFEVEEEQVEKAKAEICRIMEKAALPVVDLSVPLQVEARAAKNWNDAH